MSVAIIGGNECMARQYKKLCGEYQCKAKVYPKMTNGLRDIGTPDLLVLFTNTVSHTLTDEVRQPEGHVLRYTLEYKMVRSVLDQTKGKSVGTVRRRREGKDCKVGRSMGNVDCCDCTFCRSFDMGCYRSDYPGGSILVVFCPCALVLATPTAVMAAIGNATKHGFLVREGDALERLSAVKRVAFDKTGTLTYGTPQVTAVQSTNVDYTEDMLYAYAASAEQLSEHPLGKAVVRCFRQADSLEFFPSGEFQMLPGQGVSASVNGRKILAGNEGMLSEKGIALPESVRIETERHFNKGSTVIYVAADGQLAGYIVLSDTIRGESSRMVSELASLGIVPVLLTGDHKNAADTIAGKLHISEIHAGCLPKA